MGIQREIVGESRRIHRDGPIDRLESKLVNIKRERIGGGTQKGEKQ